MTGAAQFLNSQRRQAVLKYVLFFVLVLGSLWRISIARAQSEGDVRDPCGEGVGSCIRGLMCEVVGPDGKRECRGWINYPTTILDDCAPKLIIREGKCQLDLGQGTGEQLGIGESTEDIPYPIVKFINIALGFV